MGTLADWNAIDGSIAIGKRSYRWTVYRFSDGWQCAIAIVETRKNGERAENRFVEGPATTGANFLTTRDAIRAVLSDIVEDAFSA